MWCSNSDDSWLLSQLGVAIMWMSLSTTIPRSFVISVNLSQKFMSSSRIAFRFKRASPNCTADNWATCLINHTSHARFCLLHYIGLHLYCLWFCAYAYQEIWAENRHSHISAVNIVIWILLNTTGYSDDVMYYAYRNYVALTANIYKSTTRYIVTYARIRDHAVHVRAWGDTWLCGPSSGYKWTKCGGTWLGESPYKWKEVLKSNHTLYSTVLS